jgi:hypothetical protein
MPRSVRFRPDREVTLRVFDDSQRFASKRNSPSAAPMIPPNEKPMRSLQR